MSLWEGDIYTSARSSSLGWERKVLSAPRTGPVYGSSKPMCRFLSNPAPSPRSSSPALPRPGPSKSESSGSGVPVYRLKRPVRWWRDVEGICFIFQIPLNAPSLKTSRVLATKGRPKSRRLIWLDSSPTPKGSASRTSDHRTGQVRRSRPRGRSHGSETRFGGTPAWVVLEGT